MFRSDDNCEATIEYLLSNGNINTRQLFSLCITNVSEHIVGRLKDLIDSKQLFNDYRMKITNFESIH